MHKTTALTFLGGIVYAATISIAVPSHAAAFPEPQETAGWRNIDASRLEKERPVKVLWKADLSKWPEGFKVTMMHGAEGRVELVESPWGKAIKIVKTNDRGVITVSTKEPVEFRSFTKLQGYAYAAGEKNDPDYALGFVRLQGMTENLHYYPRLDERGAGGPYMSSLVNTAPGMRIRKWCRFLACEQDGTLVTPHIVVAGQRSESVWSDWGVEELDAAQEKWKKYTAEHSPRDHSGDRMDEAEFDARLAGDTEHVAKVVKREGRPVLLVDGVEQPPVMYKGFSHYGNTNKIIYCGERMCGDGVKIQVAPVAFRDWWSHGGFDAKGAARMVKNVMRLAPDGLFVLSLNVSTYSGFVEDHPESEWIDREGNSVYGNRLYGKRGKADQRLAKAGKLWKWPSMSSPTLRREVAARIGELIAELRAQGLAKRVVGVHVCGFNDGQLSSVTPDFSPCAQEAFIRWQQRWLGEVKWRTAPKFDGEQEYFKLGEDDARVAYFRFCKGQGMDFIEDVAKSFKRAIGKDVIVTRWCMSPYKGQYNDALDLAAYANSDVVDILTPQPEYALRVPGVSIASRVPMASFREHGKLMVSEFDFRTYASVHSGDVGELRHSWLSQATDFPMWQTIYHKVLAMQLAPRMGWWFFDMGGGWFDTPEISRDIGSTVEICRELEKCGPVEEPVNVAYVLDEAGFYYRNTIPLKYTTTDEAGNVVPWQVLSNSGVPSDIWLLDDFLKKPALAQKYRTLVFAGLYAIDAKRKAFLETLKSDGRTLVFLDRTGISGGAEATGFELVHEKNKYHGTVPEKGVTENMISCIVNSQQARYIFKNPDMKPCGYWRPVRTAIVEKPNLTVKSRYEIDGAVAVAELREKDWKGVFVAETGGLSPDYFNRLVRESGGYAPIVGKGILTEMNADFVSVHCVIPGTYDFKLPFAARVVNLKTGRELGASITSIPMALTAGETRWYRIAR